MKSHCTTRIAGLFALITIFLSVAAAQQESGPSSADQEASAVGCLRTINTAEVVYAATYKKGFSQTLVALSEGAEGAQPTAARAGLIDASLGSGKKDGNVFTYKPGARDAKEQIKSYAVTARPMKWQKGSRSFFTDQTGVIRWTDEKRPPSAKDPAIE